MPYLDRVVFIKRTTKREFPTMSTWTDKDIKKKIRTRAMVLGEAPLNLT